MLYCYILELGDVAFLLEAPYSHEIHVLCLGFLVKHCQVPQVTTVTTSLPSKAGMVLQDSPFDWLLLVVHVVYKLKAKHYWVTPWDRFTMIHYLIHYGSITMSSFICSAQPLGFLLFQKLRPQA